VGATRLYLLPYSPNFDPIEQVFAKLQNQLRTAAHRTVDALWDAVGIALHDFAPGECSRYFLNSGYDST
jgi:transposase